MGTSKGSNSHLLSLMIALVGVFLGYANSIDPQAVTNILKRLCRKDKKSVDCSQPCKSPRSICQSAWSRLIDHPKHTPVHDGPNLKVQ